MHASSDCDHVRTLAQLQAAALYAAADAEFALDRLGRIALAVADGAPMRQVTAELRALAELIELGA